jgi:hypothetical protein
MEATSMHQFSFDFADPFFDLAGWQVGLQVITFENTYGLDAARARLQLRDDGFAIAADGLMWAGGQQKSGGRASVTARRTGLRARRRRVPAPGGGPPRLSRARPPSREHS